MNTFARGRFALWILAAAAAAAAVAAIVFRALDASGGSPSPSLAVPARLPGQLTGSPPWGRDTEALRARLAALHLPALGREGTVLHIHQHLDVFVQGRRVVVPAGIGIDQYDRFISPLHTHDTSGVIHVESPSVRPFTLGEFFAVWGVRLRGGCIGGECPGHGSVLRVYVDGRRVPGDPSRLVLAAHQEIVVSFGTRSQLQHPPPVRYAFPAGE
jgi:hypothetical protein